MDQRSRTVRAKLRGMAPAASIPYIQSFQLPEDEELVLIECDARGRSVQQVAQAMRLSPETVWRRRRSALRKISKEIKGVSDSDTPLLLTET